MSNNPNRKLLRKKLQNAIGKCRKCIHGMEAAGAGKERCDECLKSEVHCNFKRIKR